MQENVIGLLKILEVGFIASIKFLFAPFEAERQGFNFQEAFLITTAGGIIGILAFTFIGEIIAYGWKKIIFFFRRLWSEKKETHKQRKKFTWSKKIIIRAKMKFGLMGLALITPCIISIPIGTFVTHRFYRNKNRNIVLLFAALIFWSLVLNLLAQNLHLSKYLK